MLLSAPEPLGPQHQIADFSSGVTSLDEWLKRRALANQASGAARTFIVCDEDKVVGYYALASGAVMGHSLRSFSASRLTFVRFAPNSGQKYCAAANAAMC